MWGGRSGGGGGGCAGGRGGGLPPPRPSTLPSFIASAGCPPTERLPTPGHFLSEEYMARRPAGARPRTKRHGPTRLALFHGEKPNYRLRHFPGEPHQFAPISLATLSAGDGEWSCFQQQSAPSWPRDDCAASNSTPAADSIGMYGSQCMYNLDCADEAGRGQRG